MQISPPPQVVVHMAWNYALQNMLNEAEFIVSNLPYPRDKRGKGEGGENNASSKTLIEVQRKNSWCSIDFSHYL